MCGSGIGEEVVDGFVNLRDRVASGDRAGGLDFA
jgi:hypothetical protein